MEAPATWRSKRFELVRRLGAGGFGVVYAARDRERGGTVALKSLSRLDPRGLLRFKREFRALADVSHPSLVAPFELLEDDGEWFFTMPMVDGVDFLTWVRGRGPATIPTSSTERIRVDSLTATLDATGQVVVDGPLGGIADGTPAPLDDFGRLHSALSQLVLGVSALHQHGLVHRDLKPSNVLVTATGDVRILDFGLVTDRATKDDAILGTPAYMAPEQARGLAVDEAADWYAVGVMLYECLTNVLPFEGAALHMIVAKQMRDAPSPGDLVEGVPDSLGSVCDALLCREPDGRLRGHEILRRLGTPSTGSLRSIARREAELLVGREAELRELHRLLDAATDGPVTIVRIEGTSGAGKSALVSAFLDSSRGRAHVLSGRCYEQERVPYLALDGVVDALVPFLEGAVSPLPTTLPELSRLFPVLGSVVDPFAVTSSNWTPQEARRRAASALREALSWLARERPVVVHVDDAQWGDSDSATLLTEVVMKGPLDGVLIVVAHRSESGLGGPFLSTLEESGVFDDCATLQIGPLDHTAAVELALSILGSDDPRARARAEAIATEAGGLAMFVHELAHHASESMHPASLDAMIETRIERLDAPSRALLEVVAVAGAPLAREIVEQAAGVGDASVATERSLRSGRFVWATGRSQERRLSPYHDRIREVTLSRLTAGDRARHHLAIADTIETLRVADGSDDRDPELLSRHLHEAGAHERALPYTLAAATRARDALAFERAVALHQLVVEHTPLEHEDRVSRLVALAEALVDAGRGTEAAENFVAAAERAETGHAVHLRRLAVEQWIRAGRIDEGLDALDDALRSLGLPTWNAPSKALVGLAIESLRLSGSRPRGAPRTPEEVDPMALHRIDLLFSVGTALTLVDPVRGLALTRRASRIAYHENEPSRVTRALVQMALQKCRRGTRVEREALQLIVEARELAKPRGDRVELANIDMGEGYVGFLCGRFRRSAELIFAAEPVIGTKLSTMKWELEAARRAALKADTFTGELPRIRLRAKELFADAVECRDLFSQVGLSLRFMHLVALMDDDPALANETIGGAIGRWSGRQVFLQHFLETMARVEVALYRRDGEAALADIESRWGGIERMQALRGQYAGIEGRHMRGRAALAAGDLRLAEKMAARVAREPTDWGRALARTLRAGILFPSDSARASTAFAEASALLDAADMPLFAAAARARQGELEGRDGGVERIDAAHELLRARGIARPAGFVDMYAPIPF